MRRRHSDGETFGLLLVGLLALGILILIVKWLLITAAILVVPFGLWWVLDRLQRNEVGPGPSSAPG